MKVKYPRTYHLSWSDGVSSDDKIQSDLSLLQKEVVITEKMDGENCLDGDSILFTEEGEKSIKEICESKYTGKVLSFDEETGDLEMCEVLYHSILESNNDEWFEIELENGKILKLTSDHYVYIPQKGCYRKVKDLEEGDEVLFI